MGWNGSDAHADSRDGKSRGRASSARRTGGAPLVRGLLAGLVVVLGALLAYRFVFKAPSENVPQRRNPAARPSRIVERKPEIPDRETETAPRAAAEVAVSRTPDAAAVAPLPAGARTNVLGEVVVGETVVHSNVFRSGCEQVMAWIFTTERGDMPPILPNVTIRDEQQLLDMFTKPLEVKEGDSARTADAKETVEYAKKELAAYLKDGGEVQDFLKFYREQLVNDYHARMDARKMAMDMYRSGEDKAVCDAFVKKVNEQLSAKGIKTVDIPEAFIQQYAQEN